MYDTMPCMHSPAFFLFFFLLLLCAMCNTTLWMLRYGGPFLFAFFYPPEYRNCRSGVTATLISTRPLPCDVFDFVEILFLHLYMFAYPEM